MGSGFYADSARATLDMVLRRAPRSRAGAISHRLQYVALWSDAMYMMPPYLAFYGLVTRNNTLLQLAYDQIRLYRDGMRLTSGAATNLWGHIYLPDNRTWTDGGAWATGNGWVLAGMARTLATIEQSQASQAMVSQKNDLVSWMNEILDAAYPLLDERALLFHNYMSDRSTFFDTAGTALIAYATYRLASLAPGERQVGWTGRFDLPLARHRVESDRPVSGWIPRSRRAGVWQVQCGTRACAQASGRSRRAAVGALVHLALDGEVGDAAWSLDLGVEWRQSPGPSAKSDSFGWQFRGRGLQRRRAFAWPTPNTCPQVETRRQVGCGIARIALRNQETAVPTKVDRRDKTSRLSISGSAVCFLACRL
ncbi:hypothetical protein L1887_53633 [Cichorium endivia]|nr:hypothetical protein L1887_53633 [Cichorium endivia]